MPCIDKLWHHLLSQSNSSIEAGVPSGLAQEWAGVFVSRATRSGAVDRAHWRERIHLRKKIPKTVPWLNNSFFVNWCIIRFISEVLCSLVCWQTVVMLQGLRCAEGMKWRGGAPGRPVNFPWCWGKYSCAGSSPKLTSCSLFTGWLLSMM